MHDPYFRQMEICYRLEEAQRVAEQLARAGVAPAGRGRWLPASVTRLLVRLLAWLVPQGGARG